MDPVTIALRGHNSPLLLFFPRLTLADVWRLARRAPAGKRMRVYLRKLFHWRWNIRISTWQLISHLGSWRLGLWEYVHVAILIPLGIGGDRRWILVESTYPGGVRIKEPSEKLASFHGVAAAVGARNNVMALRELDVLGWAEEMEGLPYDSAGAASSPFDIGIHGSGKFCSDLAAGCWQYLGILPEYIYKPNHRSGELRKIELPSRSWTPAELAMEMGANEWEKAIALRLK